MADLQAASNPKLLGAGRSGQVFLVESQAGSIARKVFFGDTITNLIHYFFFGAPNPYIWNEDALQSAYYRRKIITDLVQFWFSDKLTVADATDTGWHEQLKAYQLDTKFAKGRAVALHQPFNSDGDAEVKDLVHNIMLSLQNKLIQAGFDGLVWQAGKGNPVALNNFLLVDDSAPDSYHFVWIDLEFGVPALIPLNPLSLFSFYLPKSFKYRRALFDDVDTSKFKNYINAHKVNLEAQLGSRRCLTILDYIERLEYHQNRWKLMRRVNRMYSVSI